MCECRVSIGGTYVGTLLTYYYLRIRSDLACRAGVLLQYEYLPRDTCAITSTSRTHRSTHTHTQTHTQTHRHTDTQTHRHTDTQTHRHTDTQTHRHRHTHTHRHRHTHTHTHTHARAHNFTHSEQTEFVVARNKIHLTPLHNSTRPPLDYVGVSPYNLAKFERNLANLCGEVGNTSTHCRMAGTSRFNMRALGLGALEPLAIAEIPAADLHPSNAA